LIQNLQQSVSEYRIDLLSIDGDGSLPCPKCGMTFSPEDETEESYKIIDSKIVNNELSELIIVCGKCGSTIRLTGFQ
jgi:predicted nucleic-acid-binding Zn-ribbon protein